MTYVDSEATASQTMLPELAAALPLFSSAQPVTIQPHQLRAARALLGWSRHKLGQATQISPETIKNIEHGAFKPRELTIERLILCFAAHGVEILNLLHFRMRTASGNRLDKIVNGAGIVLVTSHQTRAGAQQ